MAEEQSINQRKIQLLKEKNIADEIKNLGSLNEIIRRNKKIADQMLDSFTKSDGKKTVIDQEAVAKDVDGARKALIEFQKQASASADVEGKADSTKEAIDALGVKLQDLQKRDNEGDKKFLMKLFGTPGDRKQAQAEMKQFFMDLPKKIGLKLSGIVNKAFSSIKDGIGTFFDILKTGLLLLGGLAALDGFIDGWSNAERWLGANANFGDRLASGLTGIVRAFKPMTDEEAAALAENLAGKFETLTAIIKRIGTAFGNILGLNTDAESQSLFDKIKDWGIAITTSLLLFTNIASTMAVGIIKQAGKLFYQVGLFALNSKFLSARYLKINAILAGRKLKAALTGLRLGMIAFATVTIPAMAATIWGMVSAVGVFLVSNPIGWIILALLAVGALFYVFWDQISAMHKAVKDSGGYILHLKLMWAKVTDAIGSFANMFIGWYNSIISYLPEFMRPRQIPKSSMFATDSADKIKAEMTQNMREAAERDAALETAQLEQQNNVSAYDMGSGSEAAELADFEAQMAALGINSEGTTTTNNAAAFTQNIVNTNNNTSVALKTRPGYTMDFGSAYSY